MRIYLASIVSGVILLMTWFGLSERLATLQGAHPTVPSIEPQPITLTGMTVEELKENLLARTTFDTVLPKTLTETQQKNWASGTLCLQGVHFQDARHWTVWINGLKISCDDQQRWASLLRILHVSEDRLTIKYKHAGAWRTISLTLGKCSKPEN